MHLNKFQSDFCEKKLFKMPDHLGDDMRKVKNDEKEEEIKCKFYSFDYFKIDFIFDKFAFEFCFFFRLALDEGDIELLKTYVS